MGNSCNSWVGERERADVRHCPERAESVDWGNLTGFGQPENIFLKEEARDHEASRLGR